MKASEVIKRLQELIAEHGDCYVNAVSWNTLDYFLWELPQLKEIYHADGDGEEFFYFEYGRRESDARKEAIKEAMKGGKQ